jgi:hypothetical protein
MSGSGDGGRKQILLRVSDSLWRELAQWAKDDFRSMNGQIEYLLTECVHKRKPPFRPPTGDDQEEV